MKQCQRLIDADSAAGKAVKVAQQKLDETVFAKYPKLAENEINTLVVDDKWLATILSAIRTEIERVTQQLATRIQTLESRYADPLPKLTESVAKLSSKVDAHLKTMGIVFNGELKMEREVSGELKMEKGK
jgi:type I restriction enzyme M protein